MNPAHRLLHTASTPSDGLHDIIMQSFRLLLLALVTGLLPSGVLSARPIVQKEERAVNVCKAVQVIVSVLKNNKATPFCSSFLGIKPPTVTTTSTSFAQRVETEIYQVIETSSTTWTTVTRTTTRTIVTATITTTLQTITDRVVLTETVTNTPPPTLTITSYYTPSPSAPGKRSPLNLEERAAAAAKIPPFLKPFASSAMSRACECLSLAPPTAGTKTVTSTTTVTTPSTTTTTTTTTTTESYFVFSFTTTTTSIDRYIPFNPHVPSYTTVTVTTTYPAPSATTTVVAPFPTQCRNLVAGGRIFQNINAGAEFDLQELDVGNPPGELSYSQCCAICFDTPNCMYYGMVQSYIYPSTCRIFTRHSPVEGGQSPTDTCPKGSGTEIIYMPVTGPETGAIGIGPCA
ncbi:hypothetical protein QBC37DRAFT_424694 [Rhypophila decipiens]|uniref:Uncharacterized protein n=1 Tax=Rhypophila decipiens TaxID=261697 RepID=A0AAN6Y5E7_9PEZI|nr:hypothetical protein QBC37DRAFT_424694 [Rhypophila decipiens]